MRSNLSSLLTAVLAGGTGLAAAPTAAAQVPPPQAVFTDVVRQLPIQPRERVIGSLRAAATATLAALEEGPLLEVSVKEAAHVSKGQVLARTDTRRLVQQRLEQEARISEARAMLASRRAELANERKDLEALEAAAQQNAVSQRALRNSRTAVETGEASLAATEQGLAALEAELRYLDVRIEDADVKAPFDARVVERHAEPGEWVRAGDPLVTIQSVGTIEAWLEVPERLLDRITTEPAGTHVEVTAGESLPVKRLRILPRVDSRARTFFLIADVEDRDGALSPGQSVAAWIPVGEAARQVLVPKDALVRRERSTYVMKVTNGEGGAHVAPVPVETRFELARHVAVAPGGLAPGDEVVLEGNERLLPGAAVAPTRTETPPPVLLPGERARADAKGETSDS